MRRTPFILLLIAATLALSATGAQAAATSPTPTLPPTATVNVDQCGPTGAKKQLGVTFSAEMDGIDGSRTMAIDLELWTRAAGTSAFRHEPLGDDSVSRKAVATYRYGPRTFLPKLTATTDYKARMTFRWTATDGTVTTVRKWSSVCRLVAPQPDLTLGDLTMTASGQPGVQRYTVPVRNDGDADAGAFDVALRIANEDRAPVTLSGLAAGASQTVTFTAPRCSAGDVLRFDVDPRNVIAETDEHDNVLTFPCPN